MQSALFSGEAAGMFPVVRHMRQKQYRNMAPSGVAGWALNESAVATRGILVGTILYPESRILL